MRKKEVVSLIKEMKKAGKSDEWIFAELKEFVLPSFGWVPNTQKDIDELRRMINKVR